METYRVKYKMHMYNIKCIIYVCIYLQIFEWCEYIKMCDPSITADDPKSSRCIQYNIHVHVHVHVRVLYI